MTDMNDIRREIDLIDEQLIKLLAERLRLVDNAITVKRRDGLAARVPERIDEVIRNVRNLAQTHKVDPHMAEAVWTGMVEWFVAYEERSLKPK